MSYWKKNGLWVKEGGLWCNGDDCPCAGGPDYKVVFAGYSQDECPSPSSAYMHCDCYARTFHCPFQTHSDISAWWWYGTSAVQPADCISDIAIRIALGGSQAACTSITLATSMGTFSWTGAAMDATKLNNFPLPCTAPACCNSSGAVAYLTSVPAAPMSPSSDAPDVIAFGPAGAPATLGVSISIADTSDYYTYWDDRGNPHPYSPSYTLERMCNYNQQNAAFAYAGSFYAYPPTRGQINLWVTAFPRCNASLSCGSITGAAAFFSAGWRIQESPQFNIAVCNNIAFNDGSFGGTYQLLTSGGSGGGCAGAPYCGGMVTVG